LYSENATDSFAFKNKPLYYSVTQEAGSFSIENVSDQPYRLIVVDDKDFNFKVSSNQELLGFEGEILDPVIDTVYHARMFNGERDLEFNLARQVGFGKAEIYYSNDVPEDFAVSFEKKREFFLDFDKGRDTIVVWFEELEGDTTLFYNTYDGRLDTVFLRKADFDKKEFTLKEKQPTVTPSSILTLKSDMPIEELNSAFCTFVKNEDTIPTPKLTLSESSYEIEIEGDIAFGDQYQLHVLPDFATSFFGDQADTSSYKFSTKKERDYAFHIINLEQFSGQQSIIQLLDKKNNVVFEKVVLGSEKFDVPFLDPDSYVLRLIIDRNKNNKWDTGDYLNQVQPEKVIYYPDPIELRANWEIETIWKIK
ncbi:MAG: hypothetical protein N4A46_10970, partial [Schleiferiaceae bacterium]|nr:hypothetical protein [Schleiferiaceae bacterium]